MVTCSLRPLFHHGSHWISSPDCSLSLVAVPLDIVSPYLPPQSPPPPPPRIPPHRYQIAPGQQPIERAVILDSSSLNPHPIVEVYPIVFYVYQLNSLQPPPTSDTYQQEQLLHASKKLTLGELMRQVETLLHLDTDQPYRVWGSFVKDTYGEYRMYFDSTARADENEALDQSTISQDRFLMVETKASLNDRWPTEMDGSPYDANQTTVGAHEDDLDDLPAYNWSTFNNASHSVAVPSTSSTNGIGFSSGSFSTTPTDRMPGAWPTSKYAYSLEQPKRTPGLTGLMNLGNTYEKWTTGGMGGWMDGN